MSNTTFNYTPENICIELLKDIKFNKYDKVLEPCLGSGNFYNNLPNYVSKSWCEIDKGVDFFYETDIYTKIITNPPYKDSNGKNIIIEFMDQMFSLCTGEVWVLLNHSSFNGLTPKRLRRWGWNITFLKVLNIEKWYGRYYWVCFTIDGENILKY